MSRRRIKSGALPTPQGMPRLLFHMHLQWVFPVFLMLNTCTTHSALVLSESTTPAPPSVASYRPRPPRTQPRGEPDEEGITTMLQGILSSLLRLEASLFEPPCNATGALAAECDPPPRAAHRTDWLGRHHFGLRRQILSYTPAASPSPPEDWLGTTPGPDALDDSDPDPGPDPPAPSA